MQTKIHFPPQHPRSAISIIDMIGAADHQLRTLRNQPKDTDELFTPEITPAPGYTTPANYMRIMNLPTDMRTVLVVSVACQTLAQKQHVAIGRRKAAFGMVNTYPVQLIADVCKNVLPS